MTITETLRNIIDFILNNLLALLICSTGIIFSFHLIGGWIGYGLLIIIGLMVSYKYESTLKQHQTTLEKQLLNNLDIEKLSTIFNDLPDFFRQENDGFEQAKWINNLFDVSWPYMNSRICDDISAALKPVLVDAKPTFLKAISLGELNFGSKPPYFNTFRVLSKNKVSSNQVIMDVNVSFEAIKSKIILEFKTYTLVTLKAEISQIKIKGNIRIVFTKLYNGWWPPFNALRVTFLESPEFGYKLKAIKVSFDLIPGLEKWVNKTIQNSIQFMIWPSELAFDLWELPDDVKQYFMDNEPTDDTATYTNKPTGILKVMIIEANNLKNADIFSKTDAFVRLCMKPKEEQIHKTKVVKNNLNPIYNEMFEFMVTDVHTEHISVTVYADKKMAKNEMLGRKMIYISELKQNKIYNQWHKLDNASMGSIHITIQYLPFVVTLKSPESTNKSIHNNNNNNNSSFQSPISDKGTSVATNNINNISISEIDVIDDDGNDDTQEKSGLSVIRDSQCLINTSLIEEDMSIVSENKRIPKLSKTINKLKKIKFRRRKNSKMGFDAVIRVRIINGMDLIVSDSTGYSDPYVTVTLGTMKYKTEVKRNTLNPIWNEAFNFSIRKNIIKNGELIIKVKDHDNWSKNEELGNITFKVSDIANGLFSDGLFQLNGVCNGTLNIGIDYMTTN